MKWIHRLAALILTLALAPSLAAPAAAYTPGSLLPQKRSYSASFADTKGTWCDSYAQTVYEVGLMDGKTTTRFDAKSSLTCAQIIVITARLHALLSGKDGSFPKAAEGEGWYQPYLDYLENLYFNDTTGTYDDLGDALWFVEDTPYSPCDRYDFVWLLSAVLPDSALTPINDIRVLPDADDPDVLAFYNAGILTGFDKYGTFRGMDTLNRGQAAAMLARIVDPSQRTRFTPAVFSYAKELLGVEPDTTVLTIDGYAIDAEIFAASISSRIAAYELEASYGYYEKYANYLETYWDSEVYDRYDSFADYLLQVHGIDVEKEFAVRWDEPDRAGLTPAQKVLSDTLSDLKTAAMLFNHAASYPLTAVQQAEISAAVPEYRSQCFGFSDAFITEGLTYEALVENISKKYSPSAGETNNYLAQNGYFYGRCIQICYDSGDSWYNRTKAEALELAQTVRQQAVSHLGDSEYFSYLCWKYSDGYYDDAQLIDVNDLSSPDQTALRLLSVGSLSSILCYEETDGDRSAGYYAIFLKDDVSRDETISASLGSIPAAAQLDTWAENAQVTTTALYDGLDVAALAKTYDRISASGLISL